MSANELELQLTKALGERFIERRDVKAVQGEKNHKGEIMPWQPIREKFTLQDFKDHLSGNRTFGHYLVSPEGNCKLFAFDIDLSKEPGEYWTLDGETILPLENPREAWQTEGHPALQCLSAQLRGMAEGIAVAVNRRLAIPVAILNSGNKGLHVYGFTGTIEAETARKLAIGILEGFGCFEPFRGENFFKHTSQYKNLTIEIFPKQSTLDGKDLGNLMALPLGIHRTTGRRKYFVACKGSSLELPEMDPLQALSGGLPWD